MAPINKILWFIQLSEGSRSIIIITEGYRRYHNIFTQYKPICGEAGLNQTDYDSQLIRSTHSQITQSGSVFDD